MQYVELDPPPHLAPHVRCIWMLRAPAGESGVERIVPDGCTEIVLNAGAPFRRTLDDGRSHRQARTLLVGQQRRSVSIEPTGAVDLVGIRFEPAGLFALLGAPMHTLAGADLCMGDVDPPLYRALREASERPRPADRVREIVALLSRRIAERNARPALAAAAARRILRGAPTAESVASGLGIHRRSLERMFRAEVGLSPKLLIRIHRVQAVLGHLDRGRSQAELAGVCGYADQSHLIRDFRGLVGSTPARYAAERGELAACFQAT